MTETVETPTFPIVKMKRTEEVFDAIFFEGGEENAKAIIAWAKAHGDEAVYTTNNDSIWTEMIRIRANVGDVSKNRFAIPGSWIARDESGDYHRMPRTYIEEHWTVIGSMTEGDDAWPWVELTAAICHEANRELQIAAGDDSVSPHWKSAPQWQKDSAIEGVQNALKGLTPKEMHESWMQSKLDDGWEYGAVKNAVSKTHPCLVPYEELPEDQKLKDVVFLSIVKAIKDQAFL